MATVTVLLGANWLGRDLAGVQAMERLRSGLPDVPITHFTSGAYFCRGGDPHVVATHMLPAFREGDELALLLTPWASIHGSTSADRAAHQTKPPRPYSVAYPGIENQDDAGGTDWLSAYPLADVEAFRDQALRAIRPLRTVLEANAVPVGPARGVRTRGWAADDTVLQACSTMAGVRYDASPANGAQCRDAVRDKALRGDSSQSVAQVCKSLGELWGAPTSQPAYLVNTTLSAATGGQGTNWDTGPMMLRPAHGRALLSLPNLCMTPAYCAPAATLAFVQRCLQRPAACHTYVSIAFDQETATTDLAGLQPVIERLHQLSDVRFVTHAEAAETLLRST